MPYIKPDRRSPIRSRVSNPATPGELNYLITDAIVTYLEDHGLNYTVINDIVGALDAAKAEFNRRVVAPYEDRKIIENGDIYYIPLLQKQREQA
jgi:hypothetical protein